MRRFAFLIAAVMATACGGKDNLELPQTEADVTGTFHLVYANTFPLPYQAIVTSSEVWTLTSDRIVILANNTWADTTNYTVTNRATNVDAPQMTTSAGTYSIANGQINFVMTQGGTATFVGTVVVGNLAVNFNGQRYVYTRS